MSSKDSKYSSDKLTNNSRDGRDSARKEERNKSENKSFKQNNCNECTKDGKCTKNGSNCKKGNNWWQTEHTFSAIVDNSTAASPPELPIPTTITFLSLKLSGLLYECVWIIWPLNLSWSLNVGTNGCTWCPVHTITPLTTSVIICPFVRSLTVITHFPVSS